MAWVQQTANEQAGRMQSCRLRRFQRRGRPAAARPARQYPLRSRRAHATALARKPALPLCAQGRTSATIPSIQRNVARLADYGWSFDLQVFAPQMAGARRTCRSLSERNLHPAARGHAGRPFAAGRAPPGGPAWKTWRPVRTSSSKLSGLGTFIHCNDPAHIAEILNDARCDLWRERCLFGSNFPIEKLWTTYRELVDAHRAAAASLRPDQRDAIFGNTAMRVYCLKP